MKVLHKKQESFDINNCKGIRDLAAFIKDCSDYETEYKARLSKLEKAMKTFDYIETLEIIAVQAASILYTLTKDGFKVPGDYRAWIICAYNSTYTKKHHQQYYAQFQSEISDMFKGYRAKVNELGYTSVGNDRFQIEVSM
jgi:hypothetical protein